VQELLKKPEINVNAADKHGITPLSNAAYEGHLEIVRELLKKPDIDVNAPSRTGVTPLLSAEDEGHPEIVRLLLEDPRLDLTARKKDGTLLYKDILTEYSDLYREIRKNVAFNRRSPAIVAWNRLRSRRRPAPASASASASASAPASAPSSGGGRRGKRGKQYTRKVYTREKI
jgi:hypothetical protein